MAVCKRVEPRLARSNCAGLRRFPWAGKKHVGMHYTTPSSTILLPKNRAAFFINYLRTIWCLSNIFEVLGGLTQGGKFAKLAYAKGQLLISWCENHLTDGGKLMCVCRHWRRRAGRLGVDSKDLTASRWKAPSQNLCVANEERPWWVSVFVPKELQVPLVRASPWPPTTSHPQGKLS